MRRTRLSMMTSFFGKRMPPENVLIASHSLPHNMQDDLEVGVHFVALLRACTREKDLGRGSALHVKIAETGLLDKNVFVGSALVNMYIKCGEAKKAQELFDELPVRNLVTWNALIAGYAQNGHGKEALNCFEQMQGAGFSPNVVTFACVLKACGSLRALEKGQKLHAQIVDAGFLNKDTVVASALIDMYNKCGAFDRAQELFDELPFRSTSLWTALVSGYAQCERYEDALSCFETMQLAGFSPSSATFASIMKACGSLGYLDKGQKIHAQVAREQLMEKSIVVANAVIDMYAKCGAIEKAHEVFEKLSAPNLLSWTELIAGYAEQGHGNEALICSARLQLSGLSPDPVTYACILKACGSIKALEKGKRVHAQIVKDSMMEKDIIIASELIDMYASCGALESAQGVFDKLRFRDVVIWNVLIKGYTQSGCCEEALSCFKEMQHGGVLPNEATFACVLESCAIVGALGHAQGVHAQLIKCSLLETNVMVANALVNLYIHFSALGKAQRLFCEIPVKNIISWNVLIEGYAQHGDGNEALKCYEQMKLRGFSPNAITTACILKACGSIRALDRGEEIHAQAARNGLLGHDDMIANALVDMYAKCGAFKRAAQLLHQVPFWDATPWNAVISGCIQNGQDEEALTCFEQMQHHGYTPDGVTFACILKTCGSRGAALKGQELHGKAIEIGMLELDMIFGTALVIMYARCDMLVESQYLFDKLPIRDVVSWSAVMAGYAQAGKDDAVLNMFSAMLLEGTQPNPVTFTIVLQTCRRRGLVHEGKLYFEMMRNDYDFSPELEHYICMVDLLGSVGCIDKAAAFIKEMPNFTLWHTLLDACRKQGSAQLGRCVFEEMVGLDKTLL